MKSASSPSKQIWLSSIPSSWSSAYPSLEACSISSLFISHFVLAISYCSRQSVTPAISVTHCLAT
jgi:hypothetical protein